LAPQRPHRASGPQLSRRGRVAFGGPRIAAREPGVNVAGYFKTESGVGESGRAHVAALHAADIPTRLIDFSAFAPSRSADSSLAAVGRDANHPINLVCVNADQVGIRKRERGCVLSRQYNIGSWSWE
jgi:hypothetical protein